MNGRLKGRAAIAGIGQTEFSKESGRTELQLACEAVQAALDDAGLGAGDVGVVDVELCAVNELGEHVSGTATLTLPLGAAP